MKTRLFFLHLKVITLLTSFLLLSHVAFSQVDPGFDPDRVEAPPAVPFDSYMNIILIAAGIVFAVVQLKKLYRKNVLNN